MSRLWALRKERGYTQVKMQMLTGIDQSAYSKIERGERYLSFEQRKDQQDHQNDCSVCLVQPPV